MDELVADGDAVGPLQVLHAPGHSPGHLAFYWPERRLLVAGDSIATWPELCPGWYAFNLNRTQLREAAFATTRAVGHGDPITKDAADRVHELAAGGP